MIRLRFGLVGELMDPAEEHRFCRCCGELLLTDQDCPTCGAMIEPVGDDPLEFSVNLSILHCDACDRVMSLGTLACPSCGEPIDPSEPTDPREGPINRVKLQALGDLLPRFREAASVPEREREPMAALTDDQLLAYVTRHNIFSPDRLIGNLKALVRRVDLSTEAAARSPDTRRPFEGVLDATQELRAIYDELAAVRAPEQFRSLHLLLMAAYRAALDLHVACA
ncbi:MAG: FUSC family protein, partial [Chloroflexota bacterium]|nr:FUSC family protein [Chloroflexota bacterium]